MKEHVRANDFELSVEDIKARKAGTDPDELQHLIDDVREVRTGRQRKGKD